MSRDLPKAQGGWYARFALRVLPLLLLSGCLEVTPTDTHRIVTLRWTIAGSSDPALCAAYPIHRLGVDIDGQRFLLACRDGAALARVPRGRTISVQARLDDAPADSQHVSGEPLASASCTLQPEEGLCQLDFPEPCPSRGILKLIFESYSSEWPPVSLKISNFSWSLHSGSQVVTGTVPLGAEPTAAVTIPAGRYDYLEGAFLDEAGRARSHPLRPSLSLPLLVTDGSLVQAFFSLEKESVFDTRVDVCSTATLGLGLVKAAVGTSHACGILPDRSVACWGDNSRGQLTGTFPPDQTLPRVIPGTKGATSVVAAGDGTCAGLAGTGLFCWGTVAGQALPRATLALGTEQWFAFGLASRHACALVESGKAICWGDNAQGQLGSPDPTLRWVQVPGFTNATALATGDQRTCVVQGGEVWCWGVLPGATPVRSWTGKARNLWAQPGGLVIDDEAGALTLLSEGNANPFPLDFRIGGKASQVATDPLLGICRVSDVGGSRCRASATAGILELDPDLSQMSSWGASWCHVYGEGRFHCSIPDGGCLL